MRFFKRHTNGLSDKAAGGIAKGILRVQEMFATWMGQWSASWGRKQGWVFLVMVCLVFGGLSVVAVVRGFDVPKQVSIRPVSIVVPKVPEKPLLVITEEELRQVQAYKQKYPNLKVDRPGLYDSLTLIERSYYSQKK